MCKLETYFGKRIGDANIGYQNLEQVFQAVSFLDKSTSVLSKIKI